MAKLKRIGDIEAANVKDVLDNQFSSSSGSFYTKKLELEFSSYYKNYNSIAFINGTATMHAALEAAGIGVGDEVIVPPLTMAATTLAVLQANATPIFADVDPDTFQIDPTDIRRKITENTKAVISVALYGGAPKLDEIANICAEKNLFFLEDNAECFGGILNDIPIGCFGDAASFSFQSSKHLTSGEGGMLVVRDANLADKVRSFQSLGYAGLDRKNSKIDKNVIQSPNYKRHSAFGFNYRMPELCAAVALGQVIKLNELISARINVAKKYEEVAEKFGAIIIPQKNYSNSLNTYWTWTFKLNRNIPWDIFRSKFIQFNGKAFYGAWTLTYNEPFMKNLNLNGRQEFLTLNGLEKLRCPECPNAEDIQPRLCQLQTNFFDEISVTKQVNALYKTLKDFDA